MTITVSRLELLACWTVMELGEPPIQLPVRPPGHTLDDTARLLRQVVADLAQRGLSDGVRPVPRLADMLTVIAHADVYLDLRYRDLLGSGQSLIALGALDGALGVALVSNDHGLDDGPPDGGSVQLLDTDSVRVAGTLLGLIGAHGPISAGRGAPVNIPTDVFDDALHANRDGGLWELADRLETRGIPRSDAISLARMCGGEIRVMGQLGASGPDGCRAPWVVGFHASDNGWFMQLRRDSTLTVCPTDANRLLAHWHELIAALTPVR